LMLMTSWGRRDSISACAASNSAASSDSRSMRC
jgi:hypothetical protein